MNFKEDELIMELIDSVPIAIIAAIDKKIKIVNKKALEILGYHLDQVLEESPRKFFYIDDTPTQLKQELKSKNPVIKDVLLKNSDGKPIPVKITLSVLKDGSVGFIEDLRLDNSLAGSLFKMDPSTINFKDINRLDQVFRDTAASIRENLHPKPENVTIVIFNKEKEQIAFGEDGLENSREIKYRFRPDGLSRKVAWENKPLMVEDVKNTEFDLNPHWKEAGMNSALCLPVTLDNNLRGSVWFFYEEPKAFSPTFISTTRLYVSHLVRWADKAFRENKQYLIRTFLKSISGSNDPAEVLNKAVNNAITIFNAKSATAALFNLYTKRFIEKSISPINTNSDKNELISVVDNSLPNLVNKEMIDNLQNDTSATFSIENDLGKLIIVSAEYPIAGIFFIKDFKDFGEGQMANFNIFTEAFSNALSAAMTHHRATKTQEAIEEMTGTQISWAFDELQELVTYKVKEMLDCDSVSLITYDEENQEFFSPVRVGSDHTSPEDVTLTNDGILAAVLNLKEPLFCSQITNNKTNIGEALRVSPFVEREKIMATAVAPLIYREQCVGILFVNHRQIHYFTEWERINFGIVSRYLAMVVRNLLLVRKNKGHLEILANLAQSTSAGTAHLDRTAVISGLLKSAISIAPKGYLFVALWAIHFDEDETLWGQALRVEPESRKDEYLSILSISKNQQPKGIISKCYQTQEIAYENDISQCDQYIRDIEATNSEMLVPIIIDNRVVAVFDIQHPKKNIFQTHHLLAFNNLAIQASLALQSSRLYEDLRKAKGYFGQASTLDFFALMMHTWGHNIKRELATSQNALSLLEKQLENAGPDIQKSLNVIKSQLLNLNEIATIDVPIPQQNRNEVTEYWESALVINSFLKKFLADHWTRRGYQEPQPKPLLKAPDNCKVRIPEGWLTRLMEILVDNAVRAVGESDKFPIKTDENSISENNEKPIEPRLERQNAAKLRLAEQKLLEIETQATATHLQIRVRNSGLPIPPEMINKLFVKQITKNDGGHGSGIGLVLANVIVRTFDGTISVDKERAIGAEFTVEFPIATPENGKTSDDDSLFSSSKVKKHV